MQKHDEKAFKIRVKNFSIQRGDSWKGIDDFFLDYRENLCMVYTRLKYIRKLSLK